MHTCILFSAKTEVETKKLNKTVNNSLVHHAIPNAVPSVISAPASALPDTIELIHYDHVEFRLLLRLVPTRYVRRIVKQRTYVGLGRTHEPLQNLRTGNDGRRTASELGGESPRQESFAAPRRAVQQKTSNGRYAKVFKKVGGRR